MVPTRTPLLRCALLLLVALALLLSPAAPQPGRADGGPQIHLQRGSFDPVNEQPPLPPGLSALAGKGASPYRLVQFVGPVQPEWKKQAELAGAELLEYIPDYAFIARLQPQAEAALQGLPVVRWVGPLQPAFKLSTELDPWVGGGKGEAPPELRVRLYAGEDAGAAAQALAALGGQVKTRSDTPLGARLTVRLPASALAAAAALSGVAWIEPVYPYKLANDAARGIMGVHMAWSRVSGLYGAGQIVAVADTGLDTGNTSTLSDDFEGRLAVAYALGRPNDWSDDNGHGTHVAGSVLGNGALSGSNPAGHSYNSSFAGVAPEASLVFQSVAASDGSLSGIPADLNNLFQPPYSDGARVHTNSWGAPTGGTQQQPTWGGYTMESRAADEFAWNHRQMTILFAAGNSGVDADNNGVVDPDSIASPGTAKNVITVGASESFRLSGGYNMPASTACWTWCDCWPNDYRALPLSSDPLSNSGAGMAAFSSRGPTDDGRIKPDLVAPGTNILSARSHDGAAGTGWGAYDSHYIYNGGTSMSTPLVAGAAALVRDWYNDRRGVANPSSALIKATLINGAVSLAPGQYGTGTTQEVPSALPNNVTGWGRVHLANAVAPNAPMTVWFTDHITGATTNSSTSYWFTTTSTLVAPLSDGLEGMLLLDGEPVPQVPRQGEVKPGGAAPTFTIPSRIELPKDGAVPPPAPSAPKGEMVANGGFESLLSGWTTAGDPGTVTSPRHSGSRAARIANGDSEDNRLYQILSFPASLTAGTLSFWLRIDTDETYRYYDYVWAALYRTSDGQLEFPLGYLDVVDRPSGWGPASYVFDAGALEQVRGKSYYLLFGAVTDSYPSASWIYLDDISLDYSTTPVANTRPFRATLVWTDYPGNEGSGKTLVNDLHLEVYAPDGARYYGNNAAAGSPDTVNTVETVRIADNAPTGHWRVIVRGGNIPMGPQPFALVVSGSDLTEVDPPVLDKLVYLPLILR